MRHYIFTKRGKKLMEKSKKTTFSGFRVTPTFLKTLKKYARKQGISVSAVINMALAEFLRKNEVV
jgi:hypothetical protein